MSATSSQTIGVQAREMISSPATPEWVLLNLPIQDLSTLTAFVEVPTLATRSPEVLARTCDALCNRKVLPEGDKAYSDSYVLGKLCTMFLRVTELTTEQVKNLAGIVSCDLEGARLLAAHPATSGRALATYVHGVIFQKEYVAYHLLRSNPLLPPVVKMTFSLGEKFFTNPWGVVSDEAFNLFVGVVDQLMVLPNAPELAATLGAEWHGTFEELVETVLQLL